MNINEVRSPDLLSSIYAAAYAPATASSVSLTTGSTSTEQLDISSIGKMMNAITQMSSTDKSSLESFMEDLTTSVESGTFDASTMAASAPDALTTLAEDGGMDLTQLIQDMADQIQNKGNATYMPPPPPPSTDSSTGGLDLSSLENLSSTDKTSLESFLTDLRASVEDGTFDASTMASSAPDALTSFAKDNGLDLTQLIQDIANGTENNSDISTASTTSTASSTTATSFPPPPPPPMMYGANGQGSSSYDDLSSILLRYFSGNNSDSISTTASA